MKQGNNPGLKILHIRQPTYDRPPAAVTSDSIESLLQSAPLDSEHCSDVYRGLARIGRADSQSPDIVIVCVDGYSPVEMEFFSIVSRIHRQISIYVYSRQSSRVRIDRAIELGAAGMASAELIQSIIESETATPNRIHHDEDMEISSTISPPKNIIAGDTHTKNDGIETSEQTEHTEEIPSQVVEPESNQMDSQNDMKKSYDQEPFDQKIDDHELDEKDELKPEDEYTKPARVPWIRYQDGPSRGAPEQSLPRTQPVEPSKISSQPVITKRKIDEPLLTEEEIQALIGDDISAIAPDERDELFPEDTPQEESSI